MSLEHLYSQLMGGTSERDRSDLNRDNDNGFFSLYDKVGYETRVYSSLTNVSL